MEYTDQALILRVGRFREADCWVKGYSPSQGVFTAFAFGGMKSRRRFCGCLDPLNLLTLRLKKEKGGRYLSLMETGLLAAPRRLRHDPLRLGMMMNCLKFMEALAPGSENAAAAFALATQAMDAFEHCDHLPRAFPALFRWRMTLDQGYRMDLAVCHACGASLQEGDESVRLALREGHALCARCGWTQDAGASHWLARPAWNILCQAAIEAPLAWGTLETESASADALSAAARAADRYVVIHTGVHWDRFGYRRS